MGGTAQKEVRGQGLKKERTVDANCPEALGGSAGEHLAEQ